MRRHIALLTGVLSFVAEAAAQAQPRAEPAEPVAELRLACAPPCGEAPTQSSSPPPEDRCVEPSCGCAAFNHVGLVGRVTRAHGTDDDGQDLTAALAWQAAVDCLALPFSLRARPFWSLGGGEAGFDGSLGLDLAMGVRVDVDDEHGPVVRAGLLGYLFGNDRLYGSFFELPQAQLGYQVGSKLLFFELAGHVGPVLAGRYSPGDAATRWLASSFEWGALGTFVLPPLRVDLSFSRVEARQSEPKTPVDILSGQLCATKLLVAACVDGKLLQGDVALPDTGPEDASFARSFYGGVSFGLGQSTREAELSR